MHEVEKLIKEMSFILLHGAIHCTTNVNKAFINKICSKFLLFNILFAGFDFQ